MLSSAISARQKTDCARLAQTALDAAIQLDQLSRHKALKVDAILAFSQLLRDSSGLEDQSARSSLNADPYTVNAFGRAVGKIVSQPILNIDELRNQLLNYIERLSQASPSKREDELNHMRDFCVAIYSALAAQGPAWVASQQELDAFHELGVGRRRVRSPED